MNSGFHLTEADGTTVELVDHGDGTGTRTTYAPDGTVTGAEALTGLPILAPDAPSLDEQVAELQATVTALLAIIEGS